MELSPSAWQCLPLCNELQRITRIRLKYSVAALKSVWNPEGEWGQCECDGVAGSNILLYTCKRLQRCSRAWEEAISRLTLGIYRFSFTLFSGEKLWDLCVDICYPGAIMCYLIGWRGGLWGSLWQGEEVRYFPEVKSWSTSASACWGVWASAGLYLCTIAD